MQTVSRLLAEMYELAEAVPVEAFPRELLMVLKKLVPFDGAILGRGRVGTPGRRRSKPQLASTDHDGNVIAHGKSCMQLCQPLGSGSGEVRALSLCGDCRKPCSAGEVREIMLLASVQANDSDWLALCRNNGQAIDEHDRAFLNEIWPHILRSLAINRKRHLDERLAEADGRAAALVTPTGQIDIADSHFRGLLSIEWPGLAGDRLPHVVLDAWHDARPYRGQKIEIRFREQDGSLLCIARPHTTLAGLTKTEGIVARHFASGLSHREVAQALGVSENTVRSHLKQAYSKLGVHDKAQLANRIGLPG